MVIGLKDGFKLFGIFIMCCCAVTVCALFLNYNKDLAGLNQETMDGMALAMYNAQVMTGKVVCAVSGGCLLATTVVLLFFYIRNYIKKKDILLQIFYIK